MRGVQKILSSSDIKSIHSIGARSIPKVQRSSYLELYMMKREKDRLEKELFAVDKKRNSSVRQLGSINKRIEKLQEEVHQEREIKTYRSVPTRPLKTLAIKY